MDRPDGQEAVSGAAWSSDKPKRRRLTFAEGEQRAAHDTSSRHVVHAVVLRRLQFQSPSLSGAMNAFFWQKRDSRALARQGHGATPFGLELLLHTEACLARLDGAASVD